MTLTLGTGPFAKPSQAGKRFNFNIDSPPHILYYEESPKRIRVVFGGETIADSQAAMLLHETGILPVYYLPEGDLRMDLLRPSEYRTHCPFKGDASYWSLHVGDRSADNVVWSYPKPLPDAPPLAGYFAFIWEAMDAWFEEDEQILGHARDPYTRVDVRRSVRSVTVRVGGEIVAVSNRPLLLFETSLPTRYYLPQEDVLNNRLISSLKRTYCPYKGHARYFSVRTSDGVAKDLAWCYDEPLAEAQKVAGYICFHQEASEVEFEIAAMG